MSAVVSLFVAIQRRYLPEERAIQSLHHLQYYHEMDGILVEGQLQVASKD